MTRIYLITGFLGAGKTTFLNYRLNRTKVKVGVLMNEFGKISMDTIAVKNEDMDFYRAQERFDLLRMPEGLFH